MLTQATAVADGQASAWPTVFSSGKSQLTMRGYQRSEHRYDIPDAILTDPNGKSFSLSQELGADEPVVVNFVSTRCGDDCSATSAAFSEVQNQLVNELRGLRLISITVDPRHDTPARLRAYAKQYRAGPDWMLLTGRSAEIIPVYHAFGGEPEPDATKHSNVVFLRVVPGAPWVRLDGSISAADLIAEYRKLRAR